MERLRHDASQLPLVWMVLFTAPVIALVMSAVVMGGLLLGRLNPSQYQLVYITQAEAASDNRVTMYVHDLRAHIRYPVLKNYLGWGSDVAWSPNGRHIAFSQFQPGVVRREILLLNLHTSVQTLISDSELPRDYNSPSWSPDGRQLVYHGADPATDDIDLYIYDPDTGEQHPLDTGDGQDSLPVWSPDGRTLIFQRERQDIRRATLHQIDLEMNLVTPLPGDINPGMAPAWSPDGSALVLSAFREIERQFGLLTVDMQTGSTQLLSLHFTSGSTVTDLGYFEPAWSPDGHRIAFITSNPYTHSRIMIVPVEGGQAVFITEPGTSYRQPAWRP